MNTEIHQHYMNIALELAEVAERNGDVPVGAVVVYDGQVIGTGFNRRETDQDPTAHAEVLALRSAAEHLGTWRLEGCTLYVTLEPCAMCGGALVLSRVERVVFGCRDPKAGFVGSLENLADFDGLNHRFQVVEGILKDACSSKLTAFFRAIRAKKKNKLN